MTKQALSKYERGLTKPDSARLRAFADALKRDLAFFFSKPRLDLEKVSFRKRSHLTGTRLNKLQADVSMRVENLLALEDALGLKERFDPPSFKGIELKNANSTVDEAAKILRDSWGLGTAPITNVSDVLITRGIRLIELEADEDFDGLSAMIDGKIPVIVINTATRKVTGKKDKVRRRITLLHELAHLVLPFAEDLPHRIEEKICTRFGASFLLPPDVLKLELGEHRAELALEELKALRRTYGISVAAIVYQAGTHDILPGYLVDLFWRKRKNDPELLNETGFGGAEAEGIGNSYLRRLVARGLVEGVLTESKASVILGKPVEEIRALAEGIPGFGISKDE